MKISKYWYFVSFRAATSFESSSTRPVFPRRTRAERANRVLEHYQTPAGRGASLCTKHSQNGVFWSSKSKFVCCLGPTWPTSGYLPKVFWKPHYISGAGKLVAWSQTQIKKNKPQHQNQADLLSLRHAYSSHRHRTQRMAVARTGTTRFPQYRGPYSANKYSG